MQKQLPERRATLRRGRLDALTVRERVAAAGVHRQRFALPKNDKHNGFFADL
jgi:hypothetical protein